MGFDLYGFNKNSEVGKYFRNNGWYWRPLWQFVCNECKDILTDEEKDSGMYNEGTVIDASKAHQIADKLAEMVVSGKVSHYSSKYLEYQKKFPDDDISHYPFDEHNVINFMNFCKESEGFEIW